jgi:hypothetical protein
MPTKQVWIRNTYFMVVLIFSMTCHTNYTHALSPCRPSTDKTSAQFIIGYGSLMEEHSKRHDSAHVSDNTPISLTGFKRGWIEHGIKNDITQQINSTYLGVKPSTHTTINAVYFQLTNPQDLLKYDARESTYCRVRVTRNQITSLTGHPVPKGQYWIYTTRSHNARPTPKYPIKQSYVDLFLSGCIQLEEKYHLKHFADDCITKTNGWSKEWINDRSQAPPNEDKINRLMDKYFQYKI